MNLADHLTRLRWVAVIGIVIIALGVALAPEVFLAETSPVVAIGPIAATQRVNAGDQAGLFFGSVGHASR